MPRGYRSCGKEYWTAPPVSANMGRRRTPRHRWHDLDPHRAAALPADRSRPLNLRYAPKGNALSKNIIVTGASSGFGALTARALTDGILYRLMHAWRLRRCRWTC